MQIKCSKCGYTWNYKGRLLYATCPKCRKLMRITEEG